VRDLGLYMGSFWFRTLTDRFIVLRRVVTGLEIWFCVVFAELFCELGNRFSFNHFRLIYWLSGLDFGLSCGFFDLNIG
jgi:hypothetical protein